MAAKDFTGVFSRYFIVGFFLPAFFVLVALSQFASSALLPSVYEQQKGQGAILVLAFCALVAGLVALALWEPIVRLFEGYPLESLSRRSGRNRHRWLSLWFYVRPVYDSLRGREERRYKALVVRRDHLWHGPEANRRVRQNARILDRLFPSREDLLLPTRVGNAIRAFEEYSTLRWGLDGIAVWPRVETVLSDQEQRLHADAKGDFAFLIIGSLGAFTLGVVLLIDAIVHHPLAFGAAWIAYLVPFTASYFLYRSSVGAAVRWGTEVRASIDMHRIDLYQRIGIRVPTLDDEPVVARELSDFLLYGRRPPDAVVRARAVTSSDQDGLPKEVT
jgi:hypothetical protein